MPPFRQQVVHEAGWRFLLFRGNFSTTLHVEEDHQAMELRFRLVPSRGGFMKQFDGAWQLRPHPEDPHRACLATLQQVGRGALPLPAHVGDGGSALGMAGQRPAQPQSHRSSFS